MSPFALAKNNTFIKVDNIKFFTANPYRRGYSILHLNIRMVFEIDIYSREIYSLSRFISEIGGFYNVLFLAGLFIA